MLSVGVIVVTAKPYTAESSGDLNFLPKLNEIFSDTKASSISKIEVLITAIMDSMETVFQKSTIFKDSGATDRHQIFKTLRSTMPYIFNQMKDTVSGNTLEEAVQNYEKFNINNINMIETALRGKLERGIETSDTQKYLKTIAVIRASLPEITNIVRKRAIEQFSHI